MKNCIKKKEKIYFNKLKSLIKMEVLNFFGKKKEGRELSNFWEGRV